MTGTLPPALTLTGHKVVLREFTADDLDAVAAYASDPAVWQYVEWGPGTLADCREYLAQTIAAQTQAPRDEVTLAVTARSTGVVVGSVGLTIANRRNGRGVLGYAINREVWGRGYATEAALLIVDYGFTALGLHRIEATCDPRNTASVRVLEHAGLELEGMMRGHRLMRGEWGDSLLYASVRS